MDCQEVYWNMISIIEHSKYDSTQFLREILQNSQCLQKDYKIYKTALDPNVLQARQNQSSSGRFSSMSSKL